MYNTSISGLVPLQNHKKPICRADGKVIGEVVGDVFHKLVKGSRHMLRVPPAWAVDRISLELAKRAGAAWVEIHDQESGAIFRSSMINFERHGFTFDRGYGKQVGLALERFTQVKAGEQEFKQLPMFGGAV